MSESNYRSSREAARARVEALETQLREHEASATKIPSPPEASNADQKKMLREELAAIRKTRRIPMWIGLVLCVSSLRHCAYMAFPNAFYQSAQPGTTGIFIAILLAGLLLAFIGNRPGANERAKEKQLREIIQDEDAEYARFRVETSAIEKRVATENEERAQIQNELDEARTLAEAEEKKA